jgi:hypothetical protein
MTALPKKPPVSGLRFSLVRLTYVDNSFVAHVATLNEFNAITGSSLVKFDAEELVNLIQNSLERIPLLLDGALVAGGAL